MSRGLPQLESLYELGAELGRGGMCVVYEATHLNLGRVDAIKMPLPEFRGDRELLDRFVQEAVIAAQLRHPGIIVIHEICETAEETPCIAMERLAGRSLREVIESEGRVAPERAVIWFVQAAAALHFAHTKHVFHRDVKPGNLMILDESHIKVMDFGIARGAAFNRPKNRLGRTVYDTPGVIMGTYEYMSPEHLEMSQVDARSDVYSLGVTLYHTLTGRVPFEAPDPLQLLAMHMRRQPVPPGKIERSVDPALEAIVLQSLEKDPSRRQQSAEELAAQLQQWLDARRAPSAPPASAAPVSRPPSSAPSSPRGVVSPASTAPTVLDDRSAGRLEADETPGEEAASGAEPGGQASSAPVSPPPPPPSAPPPPSVFPASPASSPSASAMAPAPPAGRKGARRILWAGVAALAILGGLVFALLHKPQAEPEQGREPIERRERRGLSALPPTPAPAPGAGPAPFAPEPSPTPLRLSPGSRRLAGDLTGALLEQARERLAQGDFAGAETYFTLILEKTPDAGDVYLDLARALAAQNRREDARAVLESALARPAIEFSGANRFTAQNWAANPDRIPLAPPRETQLPTPSPEPPPSPSGSPAGS